MSSVSSIFENEPVKCRANVEQQETLPTYTPQSLTETKTNSNSNSKPDHTEPKPSKNFNHVTWMKVENDVDDVLVAPRDLQLVLSVDGHHVIHPLKFPHPRQVHQHHAGVDTCKCDSFNRIATRRHVNLPRPHPDSRKTGASRTGCTSRCSGPRARAPAPPSD